MYCKINNGMYGLKQVALLAFNFLKENLKPFGYEPIPHTDGLQKHKTRPITFCLCVDDFGIKYFGTKDVEHLISALSHNYKLSTDWEGKNFCGLTFDWHYDAEFVDFSMPEYLPKLFQKLNYSSLTKPQYSPYLIAPYQPLKKGQRQYTPTEDISPQLNATETTLIQQIVGSLLYYGRALEYTIRHALNTIGNSQAKPTEQTKAECKTFLDYCATYPNVVLRYYESEMILNVDSDTAYLVGIIGKIIIYERTLLTMIITSIWSTKIPVDADSDQNKIID